MFPIHLLSFLLRRFWRHRVLNIAFVEFPISALTVIVFTHFTKWNIFSQTFSYSCLEGDKGHLT